MTHDRNVALITGGAKGIGRAIAARLIADGWTAVLLDIDGEAGRRTAAELGERALCLDGDVARDDDVARTVARIGDRFGRLDAVVNNAGIMVRKPPEDLGLDDWQRVLGTNLSGAFLTAKHAAPLLREARGAIVNIASTRAHMSEPHTEAYAASKGGLVALTHALALSLGPEVRVNCVSPGWIDTSGEVLTDDDHRQHPAGRVGRPEDVAGLVAHLVGEQSGFVTGAEFVVDGGMTRKMIYV